MEQDTTVRGQMIARARAGLAAAAGHCAARGSFLWTTWTSPRAQAQGAKFAAN